MTSATLAASPAPVPDANICPVRSGGLSGAAGVSSVTGSPSESRARGISGSGSSAIIAQASIDENGRASGGASGDQASETNTKRVYESWAGWDCILRWVGEDDGDDAELDVDGKVGPKTISEWQRQLGTPVDGVVSGQSERYASTFPAINSVTFEADGSQLMKRVQQVVGVPHPTGVIGSGTVAHLQGWLYLHEYGCNGDRAGVLGESTAKALQQSLNEGEWKHAL